MSALTNGCGGGDADAGVHAVWGSSRRGAGRRRGGSRQRQDDGTGPYYITRGTHDPALGRFITPDVAYIKSPYDPQTHNRFTYCRNNPVNLVDPDGHFFGSPVVLRWGAAMAGTHGRIFSGNAGNTSTSKR
ncbi:MAG: hypothetical protein IPQ26_10570 [Elusimicrobia bacterium]|nr:hypothetical protein [Elusimicrobiota bacterium]